MNPPTNTPIKILVADDHTVVRQGLCMLLGVEKDLQVIGQAGDGREAVQMARAINPDVILMDISMPHLNGLEATLRILAVQPEVKIIILSAHADDTSIQRVLDSGASGYFVKDTPRTALAEGIRQVRAGKVCFSPEIERRLQSWQTSGSGQGGEGETFARQVAQLTAREVEVLQLIAEGRANKQTADELGISIKTVEKHRQHLMEKLNIHDTASLTRYAIAAGIVECQVALPLRDGE